MAEVLKSREKQSTLQCLQLNGKFSYTGVDSDTTKWCAIMDKYAIIRSGGKQYQVSLGQKVFVERIPAEAGTEVLIDEVLLVNLGGVNPGSDGTLKIGVPYVEGASVKARIVKHDRARKVMTYKKKIKQGFTKKQGHRQERTQLLIEEINLLDSDNK